MGEKKGKEEKKIKETKKGKEIQRDKNNIRAYINANFLNPSEARHISSLYAFGCFELQ